MELIKNGNGETELKDLKLCLFKVTLVFGSKLLARRPALPVIVGIKSELIDKFKNAETKNELPELVELYFTDFGPSKEDIESVDELLSLYIVQKACTALDIQDELIQLEAQIEVI